MLDQNRVYNFHIKIKITEFCNSTKLNNSEGNKEKIYFRDDLSALILRLGFEYVRSPF